MPATLTIRWGLGAAEEALKLTVNFGLTAASVPAVAELRGIARWVADTLHEGFDGEHLGGTRPDLDDLGFRMTAALREGLDRFHVKLDYIEFAETERWRLVIRP